jgi:hypothetical protein
LTGPQPYEGDKREFPPVCRRFPPSADWNLKGFDRAEIPWRDSTAFRPRRRSITHRLTDRLITELYIVWLGDVFVVHVIEEERTGELRRALPV